MSTPVETRYARSEDVHIAYQIHGRGDVDLVLIPPSLSHLDLRWDDPSYANVLDELGSFARVISLDKRGSGLSDRSATLPTAEEQVADVRAVMDAAGAERASLFGGVDGGAVALLFAAAHPERVRNVVAYATAARLTRTDDYELGWHRAAFEQIIDGALERGWGGPDLAALSAPSVADDEKFVRWFSRLLRAAVSPNEAAAWMRSLLDLDIRDVLPSVSVPVLVLHRTGNLLIPIDAGRDLAERLPDARLVELPGADYLYWVGDTEPMLSEMRAFVTGRSSEPDPDRVLATMMFTDIVDSTTRAADIGDHRWRQLLETHHRLVRAEIDAHRGREIDTAGDGFLATFEGPARGVKCALSIARRVRDIGIDIRAGVHTGEVEKTPSALRGLGVHIGARIMSLAPPGRVFVSSTVRDLTAGSGLAFVDRGTHALKGVPEEWRVFEASG